MRYSLVIPYFRTPEITRLCLYSVYRFGVATPEVIVVDNAPGEPESAMLAEFPKLRRIDNPTTLRGSAANFEALDLGVAAATHDLVGLLHSDTIFLKDGWDAELFGRLDEGNLAALGTFEREANPFRPLRKKVRDFFAHLAHARRPPADSAGKLMMHFLLTRRSTLASLGFVFGKGDQLTPAHFAPSGKPVEVLSLRDMSRVLWHTSNVTSLLTGQMNDPRLVDTYREKRSRLLSDPRIRDVFGPVLPRQ
ncbi:MAG: glycosyltransferase family 2 protein [Betaproteobacteria bacterium]